MTRLIPILYRPCIVYLLFCTALANAQRPGSQSAGTPPALAAIKEKDLKNDLYEMAGDHFRGREAGTIDELKASAWWSERLRKEGLQPAGDDGTFFQFFLMKRSRVSSASRITIAGKQLKLWQEVLVAQTAPANVNLPIVLLSGDFKSAGNSRDLEGKAVAVKISGDGINLAVSLPERRYPGYILRKYSADLLKRGAAAIIFIADQMAEKSWSQVLPALTRGLYDIDGGPNANVTEKAPVLWLHAAALDLVTQPNAILNASIQVESFDFPSVNIVAKIEGKNAILKKEYVLYSGHSDHDGVRQPYGNDSIYNGADDNASVNVALLAVARAFKQHPGERSALFVWHGAEERGLLGSKWFASHPTVPAEDVVAVLNGDMIGYNNPDSAALLGVQPPHRNSTLLVQLALEANKEGPRFLLDTLWDKTDHIEGWYFRSDHLSYARAGYPAIFYTTLLHPLYHTPMDEPKIINYSKLRRITEWMYRTGWKLANIKARPAIDPGFKLER